MNGTWKGPVATTTCRASSTSPPALATYVPLPLVSDVTFVLSRTGSSNLAA